MQVGSAEDKEDGVAIGLDAVSRGLVRLPRSAALVDKVRPDRPDCCRGVLICSSCSSYRSWKAVRGTHVVCEHRRCPTHTHPGYSILDQLVESRAFLPFSVVVIALVARLHTLSSVLVGELARLAAVLVRLARSNSVRALAPARLAFAKAHSPQILLQIENTLLVLPKALRRYVALDVPGAGPASQAPSALPTPNDSPAPSGPEDDLGAVVARPIPFTKPVEAPARPPPKPIAAVVEQSPPPSPPPAATPAPRKQKRPSSTYTALDASETVDKAVKRRKKKVKAKGDEIDDIFG